MNLYILRRLRCFKCGGPLPKPPNGTGLFPWTVLRLDSAMIDAASARNALAMETMFGANAVAETFAPGDGGVRLGSETAPEHVVEVHMHATCFVLGGWPDLVEEGNRQALAFRAGEVAGARFLADPS